MYPSPNVRAASGTPRLPRPARAAANISSMGNADGAIVPCQAQRMHVALGGMGEREAIRGRMSRVVEVKRLGGLRINPHSAFGSHIEQARRHHGPFGPAAVEANRSGFHTQKFAYET